MSPHPIIAVMGPTASGKTAAALAIAKHFDGEIICCDSMQIYKHMKIGTASPTEEELKAAPHHLFNFVDPTVNYNASLYQKEARKKIDDILTIGKMPILCGGTGLYAKSVLYDMNFSLATNNDKLRTELESISEIEGAQYLHDMLKELDPVSAEQIHPNNVKRVIRAIEISKISGVPKSEQRQEEKSHYKKFRIIGLKHERSTLYKRIDMRVDLMLENGLEEEVKNLLRLKVPKSSNAMKAIGYKEWFDFLDNITSREACIEKIKQNSRNYAKRQLTWFKKMDIEWFDYNESVLHNFTNIIDSLQNSTLNT